jgi:hypothetical protein
MLIDGHMLIDGRMSRLSAVGLGMLATLAMSAPAGASYRDGAWGFFIILYSIPVALALAFCTLLFWGLQLFRHRWVFVLYSLALVAAALTAAWLSMSGNDPTSLLIVVIGESIFLILLLLPGVLQYSRSRRPEGPQGEEATR